MLDASHVEDKEKQYWYGNLLQSVYLCFRSLRVQGLMQVKLDYFFELLNYNIDCLSKLQRKSNNQVASYCRCFCITNTIHYFSQILLLLLLRITYACLAGLPINKLPVTTLVIALVPYFNHGILAVQLSARNAAQFLIPVVDISQKHFFFFTSTDIINLYNASGKDMPASSVLKLLYMYGQIPSNCELFLQEGVFYYAYSVMFQSPRATEKCLAFSVILMLSLYSQKPESIIQHEITQKESKLSLRVATQDSTDNLKSNLTDVLTGLSGQAQTFLTTLRQECGKRTFESFRALLKQLENEHIVSSSSQLHDVSISESISNVLQNVMVILLEGVYASNMFGYFVINV